MTMESLKLTQFGCLKKRLYKLVIHYGVMVLSMHQKESFSKSWLLDQNEETHNKIVETYTFYISVKLNWKSASSISRY